MRQFFKRSSWSWLDKVAGIVALLLVVLHYFGGYIGTAEGGVYPVVRQFSFVQQSESGGFPVISGAFVIERPECSFREIRWSISNGQRSIPIPVQFTDGPVIREGGQNSFTGWRVEMRPQDLMRSRVEVVHQCPLRPWQTVTHIYP